MNPISAFVARRRAAKAKMADMVHQAQMSTEDLHARMLALAGRTGVLTEVRDTHLTLCAGAHLWLIPILEVLESRIAALEAQSPETRGKQM